MPDNIVVSTNSNGFVTRSTTINVDPTVSNDLTINDIVNSLKSLKAALGDKMTVYKRSDNSFAIDIELFKSSPPDYEIKDVLEF